MGVRGLTTYINHNKNSFLQDFLLHDSNLIIDGHSLCAQLYTLINSFHAFGGDYDKYAVSVRNFFKNLRKCHITPFVIFDGSYEGKKLRTAHNRLRSKIYGASKLDPVTQSSLQIFPLLVREVFKETLIEMSIAYTVCEFEADNEIAAMARHLNCPVLSYDSDFFIYNVLYIPFNSLDLKPTPVDIDGVKTMVLECKIFRVEYMLKNLGLKEELLPLMATLLGNDYVAKKIFNKFFKQLKLPKTRKKTNDQQKSIKALFNWLQNETLESAIPKILGRLRKRQKKKVLHIIKKSIDSYNSKHCRSLKYFNIVESIEPDVDWQPPEIDDTEEGNELTDEESQSDVEDFASENEECASENGECASDNEKSASDNGESLSKDEEAEEESSEFDEKLVHGLPEWVAECIRQNQIPFSYLNIYTNHLYFCSPQAEDYTEPDSFLPCLPILRYSFDLLTDFSQKKMIYVSRENRSWYKRMPIDKKYSLSKPYVGEFKDLTVEQLHLCFHNFLKEKMPKLDLDEVNLLPPNFQLFFISLIYWVLYCKVPLSDIHSLFVCFIMLDGIDEKTGTFRGHNHFHNRYAKKLEEIKSNSSPKIEDNELFLNKNKILYEDALIAASVLLKHFEIDDKIRKKPKSYDTKRMHSFAQFQCCLQQLNCLNTLCKQPFESTKYFKSFNGTFVYNVAVKLENQADPKKTIIDYLKGANTVVMFYKSLCSIFEKCSTQMELVTAKLEKNKKRRRRKKNLDDEIDLIVKQIEFEVVI